MNRRSFVSMLGLAPAVAVVAPATEAAAPLPALASGGVYPTGMPDVAMHIGECRAEAVLPRGLVEAMHRIANIEASAMMNRMQTFSVALDDHRTRRG